MNKFQKLIAEFHMNAIDSVDKVLSKMCEIAEINYNKHKTIGCFSTDVIYNVDVFTIQKLAEHLRTDVVLTSPHHPLPHVIARFSWGSIIVVQQEAVN